MGCLCSGGVHDENDAHVAPDHNVNLQQQEVEPVLANPPDHNVNLQQQEVEPVLANPPDDNINLQQRELDQIQIQIRPQEFTLAQLVTATNNFSDDNVMGDYSVPEGFPIKPTRFSKYYRGQLFDNNQTVAVKKLNPNALPTLSPITMIEFSREVGRKSLVDHSNVVKLIGYCAERGEKLLVYEHMPLGSLHDHLHDRRPDRLQLNWAARMKIALGAARGLVYLHHEMNPSITLRDVKSSNILLVDEEFDHVKVTDYGLSGHGPITYVAPNDQYGCSAGSNMYCFGLLLLELITGRLPYDFSRPIGKRFLRQWAGPMLEDKRRVHEIVDPRLEGECPLIGFDKVVELVERCLKETANLRPTAVDVAAVLDSL